MPVTHESTGGRVPQFSVLLHNWRERNPPCMVLAKLTLDRKLIV